MRSLLGLFVALVMGCGGSPPAEECSASYTATAGDSVSVAWIGTPTTDPVVTTSLTVTAYDHPSCTSATNTVECDGNTIEVQQVEWNTTNDIPTSILLAINGTVNRLACQ